MPVAAALLLTITSLKPTHAGIGLRVEPSGSQVTLNSTAHSFDELAPHCTALHVLSFD